MTSPIAVRIDAAHDLRDLGRTLTDAAAGSPPPADSRTVHLTTGPGSAIAGVFGFTAHHVVAAEVDHQWLRRAIGTDPFGAMRADFVAALATQTGGVAGAFDAVLVLRGAGADPADVGLMASTNLATHPRVLRANTYRRSIATYASPDGACVAVLGRGVAGRLEAAFEVDPAARCSGRGRRLVAAAAAVAPRGVPVFFQCAPGNVASLRAVLAAGARPIGSEVLISAETDA